MKNDQHFTKCQTLESPQTTRAIPYNRNVQLAEQIRTYVECSTLHFQIIDSDV